MEGKIVYVNYFDIITMSKVKNLMGICSQIIAQEKPDEIYFLISSSGGEVAAGITLYNYLKAIPTKITMHNIGTIDSIATVIFIAGDRRLAAPHTSFLYHGVQFGTSGPFSASLSQIREIESQIKRDHEKIAGIICDNTTMTKEEIEAMFSQGDSKDLVFAKSKGIIHEIVEPNIPKDAAQVSINLQD